MTIGDAIAVSIPPICIAIMVVAFMFSFRR